ncbi:multiple sugar transport system substrate-binding protein [Friedmanniella luteola]|uniref:Multiple sugar transport system substrate-binding protein n=1 Tax=Friedmanniella luteola TaxID=546871 RepID=A0A1H1PVB9_9ACTN|nr:ABC transporter substrate-binding protein [Friedmanniella luteola]SDS15158.1 multiple sugar transport system substrate-binding protein [Friedmanniella luteola]
MTKTFSAAGTGATSFAASAISRRGLLGGALGTAAAIGLAGCSPGSGAVPGQQQSVAGGGGAEKYEGPNVELAYWNGLTGGDGPIMQKLVDAFNKEHPNIQVKQTRIIWAEYFQKLPAAVSNGKAPDVGIMHNDDLATNAARQVIQPLDDVATALKLSEADFAPIAWTGGLYQDKRYGIPLDIHPAGFFYNKTVMEKGGLDPEKPPTTGDELMTMLDALKSKGIEGMWTSAVNANDLPGQTLLYQFGGKMVNDDGATVGWDGEAGVKAITWLKALIENGHSPKNAANDGPSIGFQADKAAFMINGPWMTTPLTENKKLKWGAAPVPKIGDELATWAGSHQFVLPRQIKPDNNKAIASRVFVNWISQQSLGWADAGMVPARNEVRDSAEFKAKGAVNEFAKELDYIKFPPPIPGVADQRVEWNTAVSKAILGQQDVATALAEGGQKANKILAANLKKYS